MDPNIAWASCQIAFDLSWLQPSSEVKWKSLSGGQLFVTPWTVQSMQSSRPEYWSVAFPFSRGSSQPREWTQVSCIAGRFFTSWGTREAQYDYSNAWSYFSPFLQAS